MTIKLNYVVSARYDSAPPDPTLQLIVNADIGNGDEEFPFTYHPDDPYGLSPHVTQWFEDNPDFPIGPYEPPSE